MERTNRVIAVTGSFAPWELCQPTFPSLVIHRRLAGGQVELLVPADLAERAGEVLSPYLEREPEAEVEESEE